MLKHNLLITYRNLKTNKSTFLINLLGLSCGLACVLLIYLWVSDEISFDKYHTNDERLYEVMTNVKTEKGIDTRKDTPHILADVLPAEMPEVEYAVTATPDLFLPEFALTTGNNKKVKGFGKFASKNFFRLFSYPIIQGSETNVLSNKNAIVLSQSQARSLFGSADNAIGKTISWDVAGMNKQCIVTGIFKDVPVNSSEHFDFVLSFDALKELMGMENEHNWNSEPFNTYLTVKQGTNIDAFNKKLNRYVKEKSKDESRSFFLKRFSDNYLYSKYENGKSAGGRIEYVKLFSLIALFILIISAINFMNLSTAKATKRAKEIGIKKALGIERKALIIQYLTESLLISFLSLIVAVIVVLLLLPQFNQITQKSLQFHFSAEVCIALLGITLFTGLLSGCYPALYLSGFKPAMILKGKFNNSIAEQLIRKGLVVFQFSLTIIFIVSVLVLYKQIAYVQNKNLGFDKNNVVYFEAGGKLTDTYLNEIQKVPGIEKASSMIGNLIGDKFGGQGMMEWNGKKIPFHSFGINYELIETLGIKLKEGRSFSKDFGSNNTQLIINEAAVEAMGLKNPIGTLIKGQGNSTEIIGVVKNFHFQSLHEKIEPMKFRLDVQGPAIVVAKISKGKEKEALGNLENVYKKFNPGTAFHYQFLDQDYQALYSSERQVSVLSRYFACISILISCLGLFGLAAFTAESRIKEIGIRKVLGSSVFGIVRLLSGEFAKTILISICIALPLSYLIANRWLNGFAFRIELQWWYFFGAGFITIVIALCTVSVQSAKAALVNPVNSLKAE